MKWKLTKKFISFSLFILGYKTFEILSEFVRWDGCRHSDSNRDALALLPKSSVSTDFTIAACLK